MSRKHQFIFIHIPKTGGTSVTRMLLQYPDDRIRDRVRRWGRKSGMITEPEFTKHESAQSVEGKLPESVFRRYLKFAFVRNPWDWHVSIYHFVITHPNHEHHRTFKGFLKYDDYVDWWAANGYTQRELISDPSGRPLVDYVGRFETLDDDLSHVMDLVGLPKDRPPHLNKTEHRDYRTYYNDRTRSIIEEISRSDIEAFGYDFDGLVKEPLVRTVPPLSSAQMT